MTTAMEVIQDDEDIDFDDLSDDDFDYCPNYANFSCGVFWGVVTEEERRFVEELKHKKEFTTNEDNNVKTTEDVPLSGNNSVHSLVVNTAEESLQMTATPSKQNSTVKEKSVTIEAEEIELNLEVESPEDAIVNSEQSNGELEESTVPESKEPEMSFMAKNYEDMPFSPVKIASELNETKIAKRRTHVSTPIVTQLRRSSRSSASGKRLSTTSMGKSSSGGMSVSEVSFNLTALNDISEEKESSHDNSPQKAEKSAKRPTHVSTPIVTPMRRSSRSSASGKRLSTTSMATRTPRTATFNLTGLNDISEEMVSSPDNSPQKASSDAKPKEVKRFSTRSVDKDLSHVSFNLTALNDISEEKESLIDTTFTMDSSEEEHAEEQLIADVEESADKSAILSEQVTTPEASLVAKPSVDTKSLNTSIDSEPIQIESAKKRAFSSIPVISPLKMTPIVSTRSSVANDMSHVSFNLTALNDSGEEIELLLNTTFTMDSSEEEHAEEQLIADVEESADKSAILSEQVTTPEASLVAKPLNTSIDCEPIQIKSAKKTAFPSIPVISPLKITPIVSTRSVVRSIPKPLVSTSSVAKPSEDIIFSPVKIASQLSETTRRTHVSTPNVSQLRRSSRSSTSGKRLSTRSMGKRTSGGISVSEVSFNLTALNDISEEKESLLSSTFPMESPEEQHAEEQLIADMEESADKSAILSEQVTTPEASLVAKPSMDTKSLNKSIDCEPIPIESAKKTAFPFIPVISPLKKTPIVSTRSVVRSTPKPLVSTSSVANDMSHVSFNLTALNDISEEKESLLNTTFPMESPEEDAEEQPITDVEESADRSAIFSEQVTTAETSLVAKPSVNTKSLNTSIDCEPIQIESAKKRAFSSIPVISPLKKTPIVSTRSVVRSIPKPLVSTSSVAKPSIDTTFSLIDIETKSAKKRTLPASPKPKSVVLTAEDLLSPFNNPAKRAKLVSEVEKPTAMAPLTPDSTPMISLDTTTHSLTSSNRKPAIPSINPKLFEQPREAQSVRRLSLRHSTLHNESTANDSTLEFILNEFNTPVNPNEEDREQSNAILEECAYKSAVLSESITTTDFITATIDQDSEDSMAVNVADDDSVFNSTFTMESYEEEHNEEQAIADVEESADKAAKRRTHVSTPIVTPMRRSSRSSTSEKGLSTTSMGKRTSGRMSGNEVSFNLTALNDISEEMVSSPDNSPQKASSDAKPKEVKRLSARSVANDMSHVSFNLTALNDISEEAPDNSLQKSSSNVMSTSVVNENFKTTPGKSAKKSDLFTPVMSQLNMSSVTTSGRRRNTPSMYSFPSEKGLSTRSMTNRPVNDSPLHTTVLTEKRIPTATVTHSSTIDSSAVTVADDDSVLNTTFTMESAEEEHSVKQSNANVEESADRSAIFSEQVTTAETSLVAKPSVNTKCLNTGIDCEPIQIKSAKKRAFPSIPVISPLKITPIVSTRSVVRSIPKPLVSTSSVAKPSIDTTFSLIDIETKSAKKRALPASPKPKSVVLTAEDLLSPFSNPAKRAKVVSEAEKPTAMAPPLPVNTSLISLNTTRPSLSIARSNRKPAIPSRIPTFFGQPLREAQPVRRPLPSRLSALHNESTANDSTLEFILNEIKCNDNSVDDNEDFLSNDKQYV